MLHPELAFRSCESCEKFIYNEDTGEIELFNGLPARRPKKGPPCRWQGVTCPKGTPENQKGLNERNQNAFKHYQECKAVSDFPKDDQIVRENAAIIMVAEANCREHKHLSALMEILTIKG